MTGTSRGFSHVFKIGNGNNQHSRPYPTKTGFLGDGSKVHAALGVLSSKSGSAPKYVQDRKDNYGEAETSTVFDVPAKSKKEARGAGWASDLGVVG